MSGEMSEWARALAAEVKAAAPNAPKPVYNPSESGKLSGLTWLDGRKILAHAQREPAGESWWTGGARDWHQSEESEWAGPLRAERKRLGLTPRAYFVRLVGELWP